jgi:hypothetical protein
MPTIILIGLALFGLVLLLILPSSQNPKTIFPCFEVRHIDEHEWQVISEKTVMERLVDSFDQVTPIISRMLKGEEIIASQDIYRLLSR